MSPGATNQIVLTGKAKTGVTTVRAIDELGKTHYAQVYAPPRFITCTV